MHTAEIRRLTERDGIALAHLTGTAGRYGHGNRRHAPRAEAIAALHEISTDPALLGIAAGYHLASHHEHEHAGAELLREAGADWEIAQACAAEIRTRLARTQFVV